MPEIKSVRTSRRTYIVLALVFALGFGLVIAQLVRWQLVEGETLRTAAIDQSLTSTYLNAERGTIYDTNGRVYAAKEGADGKLFSVELTLGSNDGVYVQVLSGLQEGDTVWYTDDQTVMPMMMQRQRQ